MDVVDKLLAACVGYPVTNIPWPHRVLHDAAEEITRLRAELAECKQDAKHRITRLRDALANLHGNCYVADAPTEMIAAEEALAAEALDAARKGEGEA